LHERLVGRELLRGSHFVEAIADAAGITRMREVEVGLRRIARAHGGFEHTLLRENREVGVPGGDRDDPARIERARLRHAHLILGVRPRGPGDWIHERHREKRAEVQLTLGLDHSPGERPVAVETDVGPDAAQRRQRLRAGFFDEPLGAKDLFARDQEGGISLEREPHGLLHRHARRLLSERGRRPKSKGQGQNPNARARGESHRILRVWCMRGAQLMSVP
jgi:hypothetical protein